MYEFVHWMVFVIAIVGYNCNYVCCKETFASAFAAAHKKFGPGYTFSYDGRLYSTNRADSGRANSGRDTRQQISSRVSVAHSPSLNSLKTSNTIANSHVDLARFKQNTLRSASFDKLTSSASTTVASGCDRTYESFLSYLKEVEGSRRDKRGFHTMYDSAEGGFPTIGYGHKISSLQEQLRFKHGISDAQAVELLKQDVQAALNSAKKYVKQHFGPTAFDSMSKDRQYMLADYAFNVAGGLKTFPKFTSHVVNNDLASARGEYLRSYRDKHGHTRLLHTRNNAFANLFFNQRQNY